MYLEYFLYSMIINLTKGTVPYRTHLKNETCLNPDVQPSDKNVAHHTRKAVLDSQHQEKREAKKTNV